MVNKDEIDRIWKLSEKSRMNISLPKDLAKWLDENASSNWKLDKGARSKEVTKILLEAKRNSEEEL
jgi:metal-responsive CopG/Arc/MetJ family transcriptional regulator